MLILLALACTDPEFGQFGSALEAYEEGRVALATGAPEVAAEAFARASALDPSSDMLVAWEVRSLLHVEAEHEALARLNAGVGRFGQSEVLRFERAKLRASLGDLSGAAEDLVWLYEREAVHPIEVGEMEEFAALRTDASTKALVPSATVNARVWVPQSKVLVGEPHAVEFEFVSRTGVPLEVLPVAPESGHMRVHRIVEDIVQADDIWTKRNVRVERIAEEPGQAVLGPWVVQAGTNSVVTERVLVNAVGLGDIDASVSRRTNELKGSIPLMVPSSRFPGSQPLFDAAIEGYQWALIPAGMVFEPVDTELGPRMELRRSGQPVWMAKAISGSGPARIKQGGAIVTERP